MIQLEHNQVNFQQRRFPIRVLCDTFQSPDNVGMVFRVCDALGVERIYLTPDSPSPKNKVVRKISRHTVNQVPYEIVEDVAVRIEECKQEGYKVVGLEITDKSLEVRKVNFAGLGKILVVVGSEKGGISEELISQLDVTVHIPMYGYNSSMNVVNSLSILLYEITNQLSF